MSDSHPKRPIIGIHMETHETRQYESTRGATADGFASSNITAACKGRLRHCYGYYWRYLDEFESIKRVLQEAAARPSGVHRAVVAIDPKKRTAKTYASIKTASDDGYSYDSIVAALLGRSRMSGGKLWRYAENFTSIDQALAAEDV